MSSPFAVALSRLFHPLLSALYLVIALGMAGGPSPLGGLAWAVLVALVAVGPPAVDLHRLVRSGRVGDYHIALRQQRLRPLALGLACTLAAFALLLLLDGPRPLLVAIAAGLLDGSILTAMTLVWKVSFHAAGLGTALVLSAAYVGWGTLPLMIVLLVSVGWARVRLRRHTLAQVLAGGMVGMLGALLVLAFA